MVKIVGVLLKSVYLLLLLIIIITITADVCNEISRKINNYRKKLAYILLIVGATFHVIILHKLWISFQICNI